jgi:enamine deaminase RidA (YjgF/YER057c/UK114 family)
MISAALRESTADTAVMVDRLVRINPAGMHATPGYHHVTVVESGRLAFLAGQCPLDASGAVVALDDVLGQVDQVVANALAVLSAIGCVPTDVVRSVIYVVSGDPSTLGGVWDRLCGSPLGPAFTTASTLLGVASLGFRGQLVELDLTAAIAD